MLASNQPRPNYNLGLDMRLGTFRALALYGNATLSLRSRNETSVHMARLFFWGGGGGGRGGGLHCL